MKIGVKLGFLLLVMLEGTVFGGGKWDGDPNHVGESGKGSWIDDQNQVSLPNSNGNAKSRRSRVSTTETHILPNDPRVSQVQEAYRRAFFDRGVTNVISSSAGTLPDPEAGARDQAVRNARLAAKKLDEINALIDRNNRIVRGMQIESERDQAALSAQYALARSELDDLFSISKTDGRAHLAEVKKWIDANQAQLSAEIDAEHDRFEEMLKGVEQRSQTRLQTQNTTVSPSDVSNLVREMAEIFPGGMNGMGAAALCFPGETRVSTLNSESKAIQDLRPGDYVQSCNLKDGQASCEPREILHVMPNRVDHLRVLYFGSEVLRTTDNHPFFVADRGEWVEAQDLKLGDRLLTLSGDTVSLERIEDEFGDFSVFNLDVDGNHNYYASGVLVHNCTVGAQAIGVSMVPVMALTTLVYYFVKYYDFNALGLLLAKKFGELQAVDSAGQGYSSKDIKEAEKEFRQNKDFRDWFHRNYKPSQVRPQGGRSNPDLSPEEVRDAFDEWQQSGKPRRK